MVGERTKFLPKTAFVAQAPQWTTGALFVKQFQNGRGGEKNEA